MCIIINFYEITQGIHMIFRSKYYQELKIVSDKMKYFLNFTPNPKMNENFKTFVTFLIIGGNFKFLASLLLRL